MTSVRAALGALALSVVPVVTGVGPARAAEPPDCTVSSATEVPQLSDRRSRPLDLLDIADAQQVVSAPGGVRPGSGVTVAVVDNGIAPQDQVTVVAAHSVHTGSAVVHTSDYHGTAVPA